MGAGPMREQLPSCALLRGELHLEEVFRSDRNLRITRSALGSHLKSGVVLPNASPFPGRRLVALLRASSSDLIKNVSCSSYFINLTYVDYRQTCRRAPQRMASVQLSVRSDGIGTTHVTK